ncbi:L-aspartate oxidase [uncultured Friedmanniella sp.]|uniref:L-aspartate oxidase n=1 Tax=uncultured Friedmanniella sp. TaxID=335381 RepID=UPI0035CC2EA2
MSTAGGSGGETEREVDVLVIGGGIAGLSTALGLAGTRRVLLVDAADDGAGGSTRWAQGGIAVAVEEDDDPSAHGADTASAGAGLCDQSAVEVLVQEAPQRVADLLAVGARLDRATDGRLATSLEGGHHRRRVVHAGGDATGAEVARALALAVGSARIERWHGCRATALLVTSSPQDRQVTGAVLQTPGGTVRVRARAVVLATGGIGHAYEVSTNPVGVSGEGLALALRVGASLTDVEFVQFHPTALVTGSRSGQLPLVSEALRGEGAVLRDHQGRPFMIGRHPLADLAPRDVVAREITAVMAAGGQQHVWLDATALGTALHERFPTIAALCRAVGVDPAVDLIPVAPAEHFLCGGVATDHDGATDVPGLFAVGEVASTGVHGANRLASNSLLEGLVFGRRVAARLTLRLPDLRRGDDELALDPDPEAAELARTLLTAHAGIVRDGSGLAAARRVLASRASQDPTWLVAASVVAAADLRQESRGTHFRTDFPERSPWWRRRVAVRLDEYGVPRADVTARLAQTRRAA